MTTLAHERRGADALRRWGRLSDAQGRIYDEERAEVATVMEPYKWYAQRAGRVDLVLPRARATGAIVDPVVRQDIARLLMLNEAAQWTAERAKAAQREGRAQGPEGSLGKLAASVIARAASDVHTQISGAEALLAGADSPQDGTIAEILLSVPATSIAGGTDEIQRNIIAAWTADRFATCHVTRAVIEPACGRTASGTIKAGRTTTRAGKPGGRTRWRMPTITARKITGRTRSLNSARSI